MDINNILNGLSEEQKKAVTTINGYIRLIAGAGSGKTSALTKRVAYICESQDIEPSRVLSVTFTNKAAKEMKERVSKLLECSEDVLNMMTFHRLALDICKKHLSKLGYPTIVDENGEECADINIGSTPISSVAADFFKDHENEFSSLDETDKKTFVNSVIRYTKSIINGHNYVNLLLSDEDKLESPVDVVKYEKEKAETKKEIESINRKVRNLKAEIKKNYSKTEECYEYVYNIRKFQREIAVLRSKDEGDSPTKSWARQLLKRKISTKTIDFDDIIMYAEFLLTNYPDVREYWQEQFDYIQVDEFQDTDYTQLNILKLLSEKNKNLFVVGDPDQSIYQFRGVKPEVFNTLDEKLPGLQTIFMENNYRSSEAVVRAGNSIIKMNKNRIAKTSIPCANIKDVNAPVYFTGSSNYSCAQLEYAQIKQLIEKGVDPNDICVLYRDKNCDLSYELVNILKQTDIPMDCQFNRITFPDTFEEITLSLLKYRHNNGSNFLGNFIDQIYGDDYTEIFDKARIDRVDFTDPQDVYDCIEEYYPKSYTKKGEPTGKYKKFDNAKEEIASKVKETVKKWNELSFTERDKLCSEENVLSPEEEMADGIHIMTIHKSKGLEYDYVFVHLDNGLCPKLYNFTNLDSLEEDVRLAYVGVTRAKKRVYLCTQSTETLSPFVAMSNLENVPAHAKNVELPSDNKYKSVIKEYEELLDCYYMLNHEGIYRLVNNNTIMGYRYATMINGCRTYFQATLKDVVKADIVVNEAEEKGTVEVMVDNGKILTYEEQNNTAQVINVDDMDIIQSLFDNEYNPLKAMNMLESTKNAA